MNWWICLACFFSAVWFLLSAHSSAGTALLLLRQRSSDEASSSGFSVWGFRVQYNKAGQEIAGSEYNDQGENMTIKLDGFLDGMMFVYGVLSFTLLPLYFFYYIFGGFR
jgi:hypothetical protein